MLSLIVRPHRGAVLADRPDTQKLFVAIRLGTAAPAADQPRGPGALAVAVDTSGSMFGKLLDGTSKIERAIDSIASIGQMREVIEDHELAIIQFDTDASTLLPLQVLGAKGSSRLAQEAQRLRRFGGGTNLARALGRILEELGGARDGSVRKAVVLTDGETTDEPDCLELANVFTRTGIALICVGLGSEYNEDFLAELADRTNGFLYHLSETEASMARFETALKDTLSRSRREVVRQVRLALDPGPGVAIRSLTRVYPMVQVLPREGDRVWRVGNIDAAEETVLIAELDLPPRPTGPMSAVLATAHYDAPSAGLTDASVRAGVQVEYTPDANRAGQLDQDVVFFVQQARVNAMADEAVRLTRQGNISEAQHNLSAVRAMSDRIGNVAMLRAVERASMELASSATLLPDTAKSFKVSAKTLTILSPPTRQQGGGTTRH